MILIKIVKKENEQKISQKLLDWIDNFEDNYQTIDEIIKMCQIKKDVFANEINVIEAKNKVLLDIQKIMSETNNVYRISDLLENSANYLKSRVKNQIYYHNYTSLIEYLRPFNNENYQIFYKKVRFANEDY